MSKEYFPHDYGARLSLRGIRKDFGLEGLGFYWCFVEILHEEGGFVKESDIENIAYDLQARADMCEAIIRNYDLFVIKKGRIYSERVLKNIKKRAEISEARKNAADARWRNNEPETQETPLSTLDEVKEDDSQPKKVKKEKEVKHKYGAYNNVLLTEKEYNTLIEKPDGKEAIELLSSKKEMKGYKYKSDYLAICDWVFKAIAEERQKQQQTHTASKESPMEQLSRVLGGGE